MIPASLTVQPGGTVTYAVQLTNPTDAPVTYFEGVEDLTSESVLPPTENFAPFVVVPANSSVDETLTFDPPASTPPGSYAFAVGVSDVGAQVLDRTDGTLVVAGTPLEPASTTAYGVVVAITPASAVADPGTTVNYTIQVTNTGSAANQFQLTVTGLPAGAEASFRDAADSKHHGRAGGEQLHRRAADGDERFAGIPARIPSR